MLSQRDSGRQARGALRRYANAGATFSANSSSVSG